MLIKQIDGCAVGGQISVVLSDIYVCKIEENIVGPSKPLFYKRYVDYTYVRRKKNEASKSYSFQNVFHGYRQFHVKSSLTNSWQQL